MQYFSQAEELKRRQNSRLRPPQSSPSSPTKTTYNEVKSIRRVIIYMFKASDHRTQHYINCYVRICHLQSLLWVELCFAGLSESILQDEVSPEFKQQFLSSLGLTRLTSYLICKSVMISCTLVGLLCNKFN